MGTNIHLRFPAGISTDPLVCKIPRLFGLDFSITRAQISARREGFLILELLGPTETCQQAIAFLRENGVEVTPVAQCIRRDEEKCMECGVCTALCPTSALSMDADRHLVFDKEKCSVCMICTRVCPVRALQSDLDA